ncbi:MAG: hypothetical protein LKI29_11625, partial [Bacteroides sp.]|nr:hypothetical protein [Bacteroides sp.]
GKKLVFKYSELNCNVCVDTIIAVLMKKFSKIGMDKLLILATYNDKNNFYAFKRINKLENIYKVDSIGCFLEKKNIPFLFWIDEDYCIKYPFIPHKEIISETEAYLNFVEKRMNE